MGAIKLAAKKPSVLEGTTWSMTWGSIRGSSPLTQTYTSPSRDWAASHTRWVLVGHWGEVSLQGIWYAPQASWMAGWSVATHTSAKRRAFFTWWYTHQSMGRPHRSARGFPLNRVESYRAGMMAMARIVFLLCVPVKKYREHVLWDVAFSFMGQPAAEASRSTFRFSRPRDVAPPCLPARQWRKRRAVSTRH